MSTTLTIAIAAVAAIVLALFVLEGHQADPAVADQFGMRPITGR